MGTPVGYTSWHILAHLGTSSHFGVDTELLGRRKGSVGQKIGFFWVDLRQGSFGKKIWLFWVENRALLGRKWGSFGFSPTLPKCTWGQTRLFLSNSELFQVQDRAPYFLPKRALFSQKSPMYHKVLSLALCTTKSCLQPYCLQTRSPVVQVDMWLQ